jgi:hypothetical protein
MSQDDRALHQIVVTAPPGAGKTKLMAELIRHRLEIPGTQIIIMDGFHDIDGFRYRPEVNVPRFCELLFCLLVEPEFQNDRLADFQERFNGLWVPKFGYRGALAVYVWHVLRQSRLIDWLVRICRLLGGS